ncbi:hypothetical protein EDEG_01227 [Edhazardia aedis USNM 41457]|uniref:MPN domain-containing protein n=1 Tax=Edhazardia aedis (strain USNM 41457) TaxID=1003232 RepID=J9DAN3_EDHAE|nr:hypothetical protein EDEG_01227 [Edhazardia aedis USNM 41457]|eukprot:EJW04544.1 hypothetical protein EDEG_01227 [Edhazardia aedis USNM 41457]
MIASRTTHIHPIPLLSIIDHVKRHESERVLGILLGTEADMEIHVHNAFAVPFNEDEQNWYIDTSYLKNMYSLFRKVNSNEEILGWYHTGTETKFDIEIMQYVKTLVKNNDPLLVVARISGERRDVVSQPKAFRINAENKFYNVDISIASEEAEEVGVEHLLRDIKDMTDGHMDDEIRQIKDALGLYNKSLKKISKYLKKVLSGGLSVNNDVIMEIQDLLNMMPVLKGNCEENLHDVYISCLTKNVIKLNDLVRNRAENEGIIH